jgi:hypothetical protein
MGQFLVLKVFSMKTHYDTKHASTFDKSKGKFRMDKVYEMRSKLSGQQSLFNNMSSQSETLAKARYAVVEIIAKKSKSFSESEFVNVLNVLLIYVLRKNPIC